MAVIVAAAAVTVEGAASITELAGDTLLPFITNNEYAFIEFYAPWCGHCKNLVPEFSKLPAALQVLQQDVKVAKIDAAEYKDASRSYGVTGFPSLRLFVGGVMAVLELKVVPTAESLTEWVRRKLEPPFVQLRTEAEVQAHVASAAVSIVGFASEAGAAEFTRAFAGATRSVDDVPVALVTGADAASIAASVGMTSALPATVVFTPGTKYAKPVTVYGGDLANSTTFLDFLADASTPLVQGWGTYGRKLMKGVGPPMAVLVFADEISDLVWELARETVGDVAVVQIPITGDTVNAKLLDAFGNGVGKEGVTIVRVTGMKTFRYEAKIVDSVAAVRAYIDGIVSGRIKATLKSEAPPATPTVGGLTTLVGTTFDAVALDSSKHVLVEFYAPWCGHCKSLVPVYAKVAQHFESVPNVVVAKMDSTANEAESVYVKSFPTIKYYGPDNIEVDYTGGRTAEDFINFLERKNRAP